MGGFEVMIKKLKKCGGCKKYDCDDFPYSEKEGIAILNPNCLMCKWFKKFNLYSEDLE